MPSDLFFLDPQAQAILDRIKASGAPPIHEFSPVDARTAYLERTIKARPDAGQTLYMTDIEIPAETHTIPVRKYAPDTATSQPALIYYHGGGFVTGSLETHDVLCRQLAIHSGVTVLSVDYRLAPEHVFPAAADDCTLAACWIFENADALAIDPKRIAIGGDSAGANLATVACLDMKHNRLADVRRGFPVFQLLIYPVTDLRMQSPSMDTYAAGYLLSRESMAYFRSHYTPDPAMYVDWRASPLLAPDLTGMPPTFVLTAGYDPLRDEGRMYADVLSAAGVPTQYLCFERQMHGFMPMGGLLDEANLAVQLCAHQLKRHLAC